MTTLIAIDTSTEACSAALYHEGEISEIFELLPRQHAARLLPMVERLLREAAMDFSCLDAVAFGRGPGSFTGLRIAAGVAQGLAFGLGVPVLPVSTLAALALQAHRNEQEKPSPTAAEPSRVLACLDARIGEVYWGLFEVEEEGVRALLDEGLCAPSELCVDKQLAGGALIGAGNGWKMREQMPAETLALIAHCDEAALPRAGTMAALAAGDWQRGLALPPEQAAPVYLRDKVTQY